MEGTDLSAVPSLVKALPWNGLQRYNRYHLSEGDAVAVPFGSVALIVGIEHVPEDVENPARRKVKEFSWCSYLTIPILDISLDAQEAQCSKAAVASSFSLACAEVGDAWSSYTPAIKSWKAAL